MTEQEEFLEHIPTAVKLCIIAYSDYMKGGTRFSWEDVTLNSFIEEINAAGGFPKTVVNSILDNERFQREELLQQLQLALVEHAKASIVAKKFLENFEPDDENFFHLEDDLDYAIFLDEDCTDEVILQLRENDQEFLFRVYQEVVREYRWAHPEE